MSAYRHTIYLIIKFFSVIGIVLCLAGIAGSWIVNEPLTNGLTKGVAGVEYILNLSAKGVVRVESELTEIRGRIDKINQEIARAGNEFADNTLALSLIAKITQWKLGNRIETATDAVNLIQDTVASANQIIATVNDLPFFSLPVLPIEKIEVIEKHLSEAQAVIHDIEVLSVDTKSGMADKAVSALRIQTAKINRIALDIQMSVAEFGSLMDAAKNTTIMTKTHIPFWIDLASLIFSLVFVWLVLAQLCLFIHSRD